MDRRTLAVRATLAFTAGGLLGNTLSMGISTAHAQTALKPTPQDTEGPYYPTAWAGEVDADLATYQGKPFGRGTPMEIQGRVRDISGGLVAQAQVEIWQCDDTGKYRHPRDDGEGPAQRGFQGFGRMRTAADGAYAFRTIKPVMYGGRPPHVHFRVIAAGFTTLTTQMYFTGENTERSAFSGGFSQERERLTVTTTQAAGKLLAAFDLVLAKAG
jgi:protocatechuate 3,4-dioxygenase, beta subunit